MDITVEKMEKKQGGGDKETSDYRLTDCLVYTVSVEKHRILTVVTQSQKVAGEWFAEVLKSYRRTNSGKLIVVGFCSENVKPYGLFTICLGSQCLHFIPAYRVECRHFRAFLSDPRIVAVGFNISPMAKDLEDNHGVKLCKAVDVNKEAECVYKASDLEIGRYDLDKLAKTVLGKQFDVVRRKPTGLLPIFRDEYMKFATVDVYLLYLLGNELLSHRGYIFANPSSYSSNQKNLEKKKKKVEKSKKDCSY